MKKLVFAKTKPHHRLLPRFYTKVKKYLSPQLNATVGHLICSPVVSKVRVETQRKME